MDETIFTAEKLYRAYRTCVKNKKNTVNALKFEMNREENLFSLLQELRTGRYEISRHICFVVTEPAPREIFAAHFRDRVVHHLLCNEIERFFESSFSEHSHANRKGKGSHRAVKKLRWYMRRGGTDGGRLYFLKLDVKSFFRRIDKEILWELLKGGIEAVSVGENWKREVLWLARKIIFHNPTENHTFKGRAETRKLLPAEKSLFSGDGTCGLPIGNVTSQFFANVYLNELDHYVENVLGFSRYLRYVDDAVILDEDYGRLVRTIGKIEVFLEWKLNLSLCSEKTLLRRTDAGIDFLGYYVKPTHMLVRRKVVRRMKKKLFECQDDVRRPMSDRALSVAVSYLGHLGHADSFCLRWRLFGGHFQKITKVGSFY